MLKSNIRVDGERQAAPRVHYDWWAYLANDNHEIGLVTSPKEIVREFFSVFSTGDVERILECLTDDATWWVAGTIPHMSGENSKEALGELLRQAVTLYKGKALRITPTSMISEGDSVAVEAEGFAELIDGRIYANQYHFHVEVMGHRIRRVKEYSDTQLMFLTFSQEPAIGN